jgi:hypothetical protein
MEACYGGTDVMEMSCAVARGIDINMPLPIPPLCPPVLVVSLFPPVPLVPLLIPPRVLRSPVSLMSLGPYISV